MPHTTTRYVNLDTLRMRGASATTVVKLMMACNDLSLANQALADWSGAQAKDRRDSEVGARMYFVRVQLAHLFEAMKIIEEIKANPELMKLVSRCDTATQQSFHELESFLPGQANRPAFERLVGQVRHNLTFHYHQCSTLISRAIEDRAARPEARLSSITRGDTAFLWHFKIADDIVDSIVVRQIWSIPRTADLRTEADAIAERVHQIFLRFMDFSGEFIWRYCEQ